MVASLGLAMVSAQAQDAVIQKDKQRREGQILGMSDGKIKIKVGPVETSIAMDQVASVVKAPPKAFEDALVAWQSGDANKTLTILKPLVDTFRGLPTPWAERSSALLGDVYLALDQLPAAETAFADFQKAYPGSASLSEIGLARLAVSKKDYATAKGKLQPVLEEAAKVTLAGTGDSAAFGQAFYLMGLVNEAEGNKSEALSNYLSTVALFYEDKAVVAKAQERADILIDQKVIVP